MLSGGYHFNDDARRTQGTIGNNLFEKRDMNSLFIDTVFKYDGWAFQGSYMNRMSDDPITLKDAALNPSDFSEMRFVYVGSGFDTQLSYLFETNYELIGRFSQQEPHDSIGHLTPKTNQFTLRITKYIWEHALKLQAEVTKTDLNYFDNSKDNNWYFRFQVEIGI